MRRWKRIEKGNFNIGDILTLVKDDGDDIPLMCRIIDGKQEYSETKNMVEIDEYGNIIRRYSKHDKRNEGTLVTGNIPVGCVEDRIAVLEKEVQELKKIQSLEKENEFEPGWYVYWDNNTSHIIGYYVDFIRTNENLNKKLSCWDNVVKIDKDAFDKLLKPKTIYDWSKIPKEYNWAVINENGDVHACGCIDKPIINEYATGWRIFDFTHGWKNFNKSIIINPVDDWTKSCEHRPE